MTTGQTTAAHWPGIPGVCGRCGNTGVVHGPGGNGSWTNEPCDCDVDICGGCGQSWPCDEAAGEAVSGRG